MSKERITERSEDLMNYPECTHTAKENGKYERGLERHGRQNEKV